MGDALAAEGERVDVQRGYSSYDGEQKFVWEVREDCHCVGNESCER